MRWPHQSTQTTAKTKHKVKKKWAKTWCRAFMCPSNIFLFFWGNSQTTFVDIDTDLPLFHVIINWRSSKLSSSRPDFNGLTMMMSSLLMKFWRWMGDVSIVVILMCVSTLKIDHMMCGHSFYRWNVKIWPAIESHSGSHPSCSHTLFLFLSCWWKLYGYL